MDSDALVGNLHAEGLGRGHFHSLQTDGGCVLGGQGTRMIQPSCQVLLPECDCGFPLFGGLDGLQIFKGEHLLGREVSVCMRPDEQEANDRNQESYSHLHGF